MFMRRLLYLLLAVLVLLPIAAGVVGAQLSSVTLHPANLNPDRHQQAAEMLARTGATKADFDVTAADGAILRGWKIQPKSPNGDWVLLYHGISDNRTGNLGHAEFLLTNGYSVVMMDSRAHGQSGGAMATYGWKERDDTRQIVDALCANGSVHHLYALGVSMGAAIALQSAAVEPRIDAVVAEDPFESLREVTYDYAGLEFSPLLGRTLFRPASMAALHGVKKDGGFDPDDVSPKKAVAARAFPVLLICGTADHRIPCRHAQAIYQAAIGPKELWIVPGAAHASALGHAPKEYQKRVIEFFEKYPEGKPKESKSETRPPA
jgi:alpha-beta hydrolase superfamily lysophospholipase